MEELSETLAQEVKDFGIHVTIVEPGAYATDFGGSSAVHTTALSAYDELKARFYTAISSISLGKPEATVDAILKLLNCDNPPLHFLLGKDAFPLIKQEYEKRLVQWDAWQDVAVAAHGA